MRDILRGRPRNAIKLCVFFFKFYLWGTPCLAASAPASVPNRQSCQRTHLPIDTRRRLHRRTQRVVHVQPRREVQHPESSWQCWGLGSERLLV
jgi:hypothetical protein